MAAWKKTIFILLAGVVAIFIQSAIPRWLLAPNLVLVIIAFLAFHEVSVLGAVLAFLLGLLFDLSSGLLLGPFAAAFIAIYALLSSVSQRVFVSSPFAAFVAVFAASPIATIVYRALEYQFKPLSVGPFILIIIGEAFFNALLAPVVFTLLAKIIRQPATGSRRGGNL